MISLVATFFIGLIATSPPNFWADPGAWIDYKLANWMSNCIESSLRSSMDVINIGVGTLNSELSASPETWHSIAGTPTMYSFIKTISDTAVVPIALIIMAYVVCYEFITACLDKNNLHDFDTYIFFRFIVKVWIAVYLLSHTFEIAMSIFAIGQKVCSSALGILSVTSNTGTLWNDSFHDTLMTMDFGQLVLIWLLSTFVYITMFAVGAIITVVIVGRMVEIFMYCAAAPIPFATLTNREWGDIGMNYIKSLFALAFQGFFIVIAVSIFTKLQADVVSSIANGALTIIKSLVMSMAYSIVLCFTLLKTGSISKAIFNAH